MRDPAWGNSAVTPLWQQYQEGGSHVEEESRGGAAGAADEEAPTTAVCVSQAAKDPVVAVLRCAMRKIAWRNRVRVWLARWKLKRLGQKGVLGH